MGKKLTNNEFIEKAKMVHGERYDYSKVKYINRTTPVCIICSEHGEFWQTPRDHSSGCGCPECAKALLGKDKKLGNEEFIRRAVKIHNGKYDYSKVNYINANVKVIIICPNHGEFLQKPSMHLNGNGCPMCRNERTGNLRRLTIEEFIKRANFTHNNKYDYSKVVYKSENEHINIICPKHGVFSQAAGSHLSGAGCPKCAWETKGMARRSSVEEFIEKSNKVHNNKYDYSKVVYVNSHTKVCIICPVHGEFWQTPNMHLYGSGCPRCVASLLENCVENMLVSNDIRYETEKKFDFLGSKRLDFYLPDYNTAIECHGGQHFFSVKYFGGEKGFINTVRRDREKYLQCKDNGIMLLYYSKKRYFIPSGVITDTNELLNAVKAGKPFNENTEYGKILLNG